MIPTVERERLAPEVLRGKQVFYNAADPRMARHKYLSCAVCHMDGGTDGRVWDFTHKGEGLRRTTSLLGKAGRSPDLDDLDAYVTSLVLARTSPFRNADGSLTDEAREGEKVFNRAETGCAVCHVPPLYTDSRMPVAGTGSGSGTGTGKGYGCRRAGGFPDPGGNVAA